MNDSPPDLPITPDMAPFAGKRANARASDPTRYLVFDLDQGEKCLYACPARQISEVIAIPAIFEVPRSKPWYVGLCGHSGRHASVTDLGAYLFSSKSKRSKSARILMYERAAHLYGFVVKAVIGFRHLCPLAGAAPSGVHGLTELTLCQGPEDCSPAGDVKFYAVSISQIVLSREFYQTSIASSGPDLDWQ